MKNPGHREKLDGSRGKSRCIRGAGRAGREGVGGVHGLREGGEVSVEGEVGCGWRQRESQSRSLHSGRVVHLLQGGQRMVNGRMVGGRRWGTSAVNKKNIRK